MPSEKNVASAIEALTLFDKLTAKIASRGGELTTARKNALDKALNMYATACSALKLDPHKDHTSRVVLPPETPA